ncbi:hypothetical protein AMTR_s00283p00014480 [Amborella trichopoda]|uniref:Uncharacterized protein n=1 Tax=Amborella trichopoda TaxID=13333 RepID=W1PIT8_AMBTC|nr:hypothetical protein AMTR_s00283p00014480 [Amborella trichopoda]
MKEKIVLVLVSATEGPTFPAQDGSTKGIYVAPPKAGGVGKAGTEMRRRNEENSIRVGNLSEDTRAVVVAVLVLVLV